MPLDPGAAQPVCAPLDATVVFDVETTGLDPHVDELRLVCFALEMCVETLRHPEDRERIQAWLKLNTGYLAHHASFDLSFLEAAGYELPPPESWHDTQLLAHVGGERLPGRTALKAIARSKVKAGVLPESVLEPERQLKRWLRGARRRARKAGLRPPQLGDAPLELLTPYVRTDVQLTQWAAAYYGERVDGQHKIVELERRVLPAIYETERRGVPIDVPAAKSLRRALQSNIAELDRRVRELAGDPNFNPEAARQVEAALQHRGVDLSKLPRMNTGQPMLTADTLELLSDDLATALLDLRAEKKIADYSEGLFRHSHGDRLYGHFRQVGTATGRMSSGNPNLQSLPKGDLRVRYLVSAGEGKLLVSADLDSIELRLLAAFAPGGALAAAFERGEDVHQQTADAVGVDRDLGKQLNYCVLYGGGARRVSALLDCTRDEAHAVLDRWYGAYPEVAKLKADLARRVRRDGYITSLVGRRFDFEQPNHLLANYLIQGSAADLFKLAAAELHEHGLPVVLYVHDEVVLEVAEHEAEQAAALLSEALTGGAGLISGLRAEASAATRWSDFKQPGYTPPHEARST